MSSPSTHRDTPPSGHSGPTPETNVPLMFVSSGRAGPMEEMLLLLPLLFLTLLLCGSPGALGELEEEARFEDDIDLDLTEFDLDIVRGLKGGRCGSFWCLDFYI